MHRNDFGHLYHTNNETCYEITDHVLKRAPQTRYFFKRLSEYVLLVTMCLDVKYMNVSSVKHVLILHYSSWMAINTSSLLKITCHCLCLCLLYNHTWRISLHIKGIMFLTDRPSVSQWVVVLSCATHCLTSPPSPIVVRVFEWPA